MGELAIPQVTPADLADFHARHFPSNQANAELAVKLLSETASEKADPIDGAGAVGCDDDDDGLGYYPDGVKRTLTDEQIAIFRHTEMHRLMMARERDGESGKKPRANTSDNGKVTKRMTRPRRGQTDKTRPWIKTRDDHEDRADPKCRTFRRIARELDEQTLPTIDLDY